MPLLVPPDPAASARAEARVAVILGRPERFEEVYSKPVRGGVVRVFRAEIGGEALAIKSDPRPEIVTEQYRALERLRAVTGDCVVPRGLCPEGRFLATGWIDAPLLSDRMSDLSGRAARLTRAGRWLRRLHHRTRRGRGGDLWQRRGRLLPPDPCAGRDRLEATLHARHGGLARAQAPVAMLHSDFQAHNLFDLGERVVAFDRHSDREGHVYFDTARFLTGLSLRRRLAEAGEQPWPGTEAGDRRSFLAAYGPIPARDRALSVFVEDLVLARLWALFAARAHLGARFEARRAVLAGLLAERGLGEASGHASGGAPERLLRGPLGLGRRWG
ncbi:hypothetical protein [Litorisediminicola beolgyonensis]|uniref:Aminoglycoside phosphotransferase domain-containing protein n=1 Tax=Litorisediminicola beolgyonensis TaxID=1173614 RepID=A0ABW3ZMV1_9RHOB